MIEIDESMPMYVCNKARVCGHSEGCGGDMCNHTVSPMFAKNTRSVALFEEFFAKFSCIVDENGRLVCTERLEENE